MDPLDKSIAVKTAEGLQEGRGLAEDLGLKGGGVYALSLCSAKAAANIKEKQGQPFVQEPLTEKKFQGLKMLRWEMHWSKVHEFCMEMHLDFDYLFYIFMLFQRLDKPKVLQA